MDNFRVTPAAKRDLVEHVVYLDYQVAGLGEDFLQSFKESLGFLMDTPEAGAVLESRYLKDVLRTWPLKRFHNHVIYYLVKEDRIIVARVLHGSRRIRPKLFQDLDESEA